MIFFFLFVHWKLQWRWHFSSNLCTSSAVQQSIVFWKHSCNRKTPPCDAALRPWKTFYRDLKICEFWTCTHVQNLGACRWKPVVSFQWFQLGCCQAFCKICCAIAAHIPPFYNLLESDKRSLHSHRRADCQQLALSAGVKKFTHAQECSLPIFTEGTLPSLIGLRVGKKGLILFEHASHYFSVCAYISCYAIGGKHAWQILFRVILNGRLKQLFWKLASVMLFTIMMSKYILLHK